jgi:hypothetical protein
VKLSSLNIEIINSTDPVDVCLNDANRERLGSGFILGLRAVKRCKDDDKMIFSGGRASYLYMKLWNYRECKGLR